MRRRIFFTQEQQRWPSCHTTLWSPSASARQPVVAAAECTTRHMPTAGAHQLVLWYWCAHAGADSADGHLQIELPGVLQKQLLDQYDAIHDEGKLLQLPRRPNVMQVRKTGRCASRGTAQEGTSTWGCKYDYMITMQQV
jgi:hypothetical protein